MSLPIGPGEAARRLGVSTRTVQRWLREGRLPAVRVGSRLKLAPGALERTTDRRPIRRLLVANRGELVVRIAATCRRLGIACLALVPEDQARAWWTASADEIVPLAGSYLDAERVLAAAVGAGADAIHPGYGFLAENADFAEAVAGAGLTWVGPPPAAMRALGDKAAARRLAAELGIPTLPGYDGEAQSDAALRQAARRVGLPLMIKPSGGGGGKGMHVVRDRAGLAEALARARREARQAFGDERLILERHLERPRHVEVQILADAHGGAVHLGERECSLQRRHQKVIEESPSPAVRPRLRRQLGEAALRLARAAGYTGAGTAEFLLADDGRFYFLELNARLQVEHPVTELVTGRDLVADQLRIAAGERLGLGQRNIALDGHAVEARLYAEDPDSGFLPATGEIVDVRWAGADVRVDAGVGPGDVVGTRYDPLLAKLIAHGPDRQAALDRLDEALATSAVLGVTTNRGFLRWLLGRADVRAGATHTQLIDEAWRPRGDDVPTGAWPAAAAALATLAGAGQEGATGAGRGADTPSPIRLGFRLNARPRLRVEMETQTRSVAVPEEPPDDAHWVALGASELMLDVDGRAVSAALAPPPTVEAAARHAAHGERGGEVVGAPMPGSVLSIGVSEGDDVKAGQTLLVLEAMKMENAVPAPASGRVSRVLVDAGQQVTRGQPLVELA